MSKEAVKWYNIGGIEYEKVQDQWRIKRDILKGTAAPHIMA